MSTLKEVLEKQVASGAWDDKEVIAIEILLPVDAVESTIQSAFESSHGIHYWAERRGDGCIREFVDETDLTAGQPGPWLKLDIDAIRRGLVLLATKAPHQFAALLTGTADATTGDCLIQLAVLGELRYG